MVIVVPSTVTVPLSLVTTVVPLKVIVVVELSESLSSDSVVVSVAESEALLVNTEAVSDAVASVVLELVLELVFSSALFVSDAEVSLVVLSAVSMHSGSHSLSTPCSLPAQSCAPAGCGWDLHHQSLKSGSYQ